MKKAKNWYPAMMTAMILLPIIGYYLGTRHQAPTSPPTNTKPLQDTPPKNDR